MSRLKPVKLAACGVLCLLGVGINSSVVQADTFNAGYVFSYTFTTLPFDSSPGYQNQVGVSINVPANGALLPAVARLELFEDTFLDTPFYSNDYTLVTVGVFVLLCHLTLALG